MTKDEALRLALEALEYFSDTSPNMAGKAHAEDAITAIKAALEAKDEPVAWVYPEFWQHLENLNCGTAYRLSGIGRQPIYSTPPQPVIDESAAKRIATALGWEPKRKPLTDETRNWIVATCPTPRHIIDAVERMHGIKGEA